MTIRKTAVKGQFYPGNAAMLRQSVLEYIGAVEDLPKVPGVPKAFVVPHAGYIYSGPIAGYVYKIIKSLDQNKKWKVVLLGPSHHMPFYGAAVTNDKEWETPLGTCDSKNILEEIKSENIVVLPEAHKEEHSLEVQLPFLKMSLKNFEIYPIVIGSVRPDFLGEDLLEFIKKDDVIVIASSDLSHYLPYEKARETDYATSEAITNIDIEKMAELGDACGRMGILTCMYFAEKLGWKCKMLDYRNSGDTAGDKRAVVGYGAYVFYETNEK